MGFFDSLLGPMPTTGLLSDPNAAYTLIAGLLQGKKGEGLAPLGRGLGAATQAFNQDQLQERANRASDLQQISGLYNILKQQDELQMIQDDQAGRPHVQDPRLTQLSQKMATLSGMPGLAGMQGQAAPSAPASAAPPAIPPSVASQYSVAVSPEFQAKGPMPQAAPQLSASQPAIAPDSFEALRRKADLYAVMGGPMGKIADNLYKRSMPAFSRGVAFDPSTGMPIAGLVNNLPVQRNPDGSLSVIPNDFTPALAAREGAVANAKAQGEAPYQFMEVPGANRLISRAAARQAEGPVPGAPGTIPPWLQPQVVPQTPSQGGPPQVAQLTVTQPSKNGPQLGGGGLSGPDPVQLAGAKAGAEGVNKVYGDAYGEIRKAGTDAPYQSALLKEMLALTQGALQGQTGTFMPMRQKWTEVLTSLGVPKDAIESLPGTIHNLPEAQDFVKLAMQRAMSQTRTLGAREAASVFNQVQQANPNTGLTSDAMARILQPLMAEQDYNAAKFQGADQWLQTHNGSLAGFESTWNRQHPFSEFWKNAEQNKAQATPGVRRYNPTTGKIE